MKYIIGLVLMLGIMGDSYEPNNYRETQTITGRVVNRYQVSASFVAMCQLDGAHAVIDTPTKRYDVAGNQAGETIVGDSVVATIKIYRECNFDNYRIVELRIIK